jgi:predicted RND superfamily exporter protein/CRP-like cAMP-binding protein
MKYIMKWIVLHPLISGVIVILFAGSFGIGLWHVTRDSSATGLFVKDDPDVQAYNQAKEIFGEDIILTIVIKAKDIFQPDILETIISMTIEAEGLDGVTRVVSLATANNLDGSEGVLNAESLLPYVPETPEEMKALREKALSNEIFRGEVLNARGTATAIHLFVEDRPKEEGYNNRLVSAAQEMIDQAQQHLGPKVEMYQCGSPYLKTNILASIQRDGETLTPASLVALFLVLFLFFRTTSAVLIPLVTGLTSVVITLGFMGFMGFAINPVSVIIPTLLIVVGCTEDIHLLAEYGLSLKGGMEKNNAIRHMAVKGGLAILLTSLTTFVGFVTLSPNSIPMLREFGIAASFGMMANFTVTILMAPHMLRWFKPHVAKQADGKFLRWGEGLVARACLKHRKGILIGSVAFLVAAIGCSSLVKVDTDYLRFFKKDSEVRRVYRDFTKNLVGGTNFMVIISGNEPGAMKSPEVLENVVRLSDYLASKYDKVLGYTDFLRKMHKEMNDGNQAYWKLPQSQELIAQYTLLLNQDDLARFVDFDFKRTCILVRAALSGSKVINAEVGKIRDFIDTQLSQDLKYTITGEPVIVSKASDTISRELVINLAYVLGAIFIFISILFMSLKAGLLAMMPNIIPIVMNFAVMGLLGIPLSTSTFPVAIVALGIAVDDTIHLMVRYSKEIKTQDANETAMTKTVVEEFRPVMSTSMALMLGFMVLLLAQFGSTLEFGILATITMGTALMSDLLITPSLLLTTPLITSWDYIKLKISGELAKTSPMFKDLSLGEIKRVAVMGAIREIPSGGLILEEGKEGRNMYVLLRGSAEIRLRESDMVLNVAYRGDVAGEMGFLTGARRSANVIAREDVEVLEIDAATLDRVRIRFPRVAAKVFFNISQVLSNRLQETTSSLVLEHGH